MPCSLKAFRTSSFEEAKSTVTVFPCFFFICALMPPSSRTDSPSFTLREFPIIASHSPFLQERRSSSTDAPVFVFPKIRAGITRVSFNTRQSPGFNSPSISSNSICSSFPVFLSATRSLDLSLSGLGSCAISPSGST
ncbi:MAG: hypothetical protein BWY84_00709 [Candidatus Aerophobetes bacterium ADurb.Bin490]|nr:MAG: hypothetical protein BWY84_00709 [Candidatus Aerophobetes bacterium ADurb.Bin490]